MDSFYQPHVEPSTIGNTMTPDEIQLYKEICNGLGVPFTGNSNKGNNLKPWISTMINVNLSWDTLRDHSFESFETVAANIKSKVGEGTGTELFVNVIVKMAHMMYGEEFVNKVFNDGDMKQWTQIGQLLPAPINEALVSGFNDDTPALWDLMSATLSMFQMREDQYKRHSLTLLQHGVNALDALNAGDLQDALDAGKLLKGAGQYAGLEELPREQDSKVSAESNVTLFVLCGSGLAVVSAILALFFRS